MPGAKEERLGEFGPCAIRSGIHGNPGVDLRTGKAHPKKEERKQRAILRGMKTVRG